MYKLLKPILAALALVVLLVACVRPSLESRVERMSERISDRLALNEQQNEKFVALRETLTPALEKAYDTFYESKNKWQQLLSDSVESQQNVDPEVITQFIDNVIEVYEENKSEVSIAMTDFYNSLDQDQRRKVAKLLKRGQRDSRHWSDDHGHGRKNRDRDYHHNDQNT